MQIQQLSIFLENKPGRLTGPCQALSQAGINITTLSLADTKEFGILRLIVREWEKAKQVLEMQGCVVTVTPVLAVEVPDRPGGMAELLEGIDQARTNIEYMYAFSNRCGDKALVVFRFAEPEKAIAALEQRSYNVVRDVELFDLGV